MNTNSFSALFIDFENVYYFLKHRMPEGYDVNNCILELIRNVRKQQDDAGTRCIMQHAYADFERIEDGPLSDLYLIGVETHNVLGTDHKNAADMKLCVDVMDYLYNRREISRYVFMAGDRDYIPLIKHLKGLTKDVQVVAFSDNVSGDLVEVVGQDSFLNAASMLKYEDKQQLEKYRAGMSLSFKPITNGLVPVATPAPKPVYKMQFIDFKPIEGDNEREVLRLMLRHYKDKPEIWLTPLLHKLRSEMHLLADYERKMIIGNLEHAGALRVEKRTGAQSNFSVIIINWNHPDVHRLNNVEESLLRV